MSQYSVIYCVYWEFTIKSRYQIDEGMEYAQQAFEDCQQLHQASVEAGQSTRSCLSSRRASRMAGGKESRVADHGAGRVGATGPTEARMSTSTSSPAQPSTTCNDPAQDSNASPRPSLTPHANDTAAVQSSLQHPEKHDHKSKRVHIGSFKKKSSLKKKSPKNELKNASIQSDAVPSTPHVDVDKPPPVLVGDSHRHENSSSAKPTGNESTGASRIRAISITTTAASANSDVIAGSSMSSVGALAEQQVEGAFDDGADGYYDYRPSDSDLRAHHEYDIDDYDVDTDCYANGGGLDCCLDDLLLTAQMSRCLLATGVGCSLKSLDAKCQLDRQRWQSEALQLFLQFVFFPYYHHCPAPSSSTLASNLPLHHLLLLYLILLFLMYLLHLLLLHFIYLLLCHILLRL